MKHFLQPVSLVLVLVSLAACAASGPTSPTGEAPPAPPPTDTTGAVGEATPVAGGYPGVGADASPTARAVVACPSPLKGTALLDDAEQGYCLLYPASYQIDHPSPDETVLFVGSLMNADEPRAYIKVSDAGGQTAEQAADALVADVTGGMPGLDIQRGIINLGGEDAVVMDQVPGQDSSREVVAVHDGRLYRLSFVPADPTMGDVYKRMETLYATVVEVFQFKARGATNGTPAATAATAASGAGAQTGTVTAGAGASAVDRGVSGAAVSPCADPAFREKGVTKAFIVASRPAAGESVRSGFAVSGCANVNEGTVQWRLKDAAGAVLAEGFTQASCGTGCVGDFAFTVDFTPPAGGSVSGTLELYSVSMRDGSTENLTAVPVVIE